MKAKEISEALLRHHQEFMDSVGRLNKEDFEYAAEGKWSAGQQMEHLLMSTKALKPAFKVPRFILKQRFGTANRPSRDYEGLVKRYEERLNAGGKAPAPYVPNPAPFTEQTRLSKSIMDVVNSLAKSISKWDEAALDKYILPHPLLGKVTFREMMYFTIYHVQHHHKIIFRELKARDAQGA